MKKLQSFLILFFCTVFYLPGCADKAEVILKPSGCDYFIAEGSSWYYVLQEYGGYYPDKGDTIIGNLTSYGFKDVYYPSSNREGRVWVDNYYGSKSSAIEELYDKCK